jgi:hypothetical protein
MDKKADIKPADIKINEIRFTDIKFTDIDAREKQARQSHKFALHALIARKEKAEKDGEDLHDGDRTEYARLRRIDEVKPHFLDPLFVSTAEALASEEIGLRRVIVSHLSGKLRFGDVADAGEFGETARTALLLGLLQLNKAPLPPLVVNGAGKLATDPTHRNTALFKEKLFQAMGQVAGHIELAKRALLLLAGAVSLGGTADAHEEASVSTLEYAEVFTKLVDQGVAADDPNLKRRVEDRLDQVQDIGEERPLHDLEISLPDLEATTDFVVEADHCKLMGSFIFASAFEELRAFQVVDRIVEMSQRGEIPLIRGKAGTQLYNYWREAPNRMREDERQTFYAMTIGLPTGQPGVAVNTDFQDLWLRFVSSVSSLVRENRVDQLLRSNLPAAINQQQVKKAARDLAINMSSHGYGMVFYAAVDLQKQINDMIKLLNDEELRAAFGARDMWGVIDQVAQTELGGARNSSRYRTLATSGAIITSWMARNTARLQDPTLPMIDLRSVANPPSRLTGQTAVSHPTDYDLVNACEMWLADSAMGEDRVEQMSQPRESPHQTSRPIQIPSVARDLLEGTGLGLGMGLSADMSGHANGNGRRGSRYQGY